VISVLLYHAGEPWAIGGYLGVDAFFVLSGFLITTLLVVEWSDRGRLNLRAFWGRRFRRLLPALFLVMVGIIVYAGVFAAPSEVDSIRADSFATLGYVANWRFILSGQSYFAQFAQPSPLRHMWSLAIEEQFYLVWPLIVCFLLWWTRSLRVLIGACVALIFASATLMALLYQPGHDPSRVYYGTDTRAQSLLVGAVAGILLFRHGAIRSQFGRIALRAAAVAGAAYMLWLVWRMSEHTDALYQGGFFVAAVAVSFVIASVVQPESGTLGAVLSWAPLRWIGRVSYGLYLWHWPVYLTVTHARTGLDGAPLLFARLAVTVALATLSFYAVEQPIRQRRFRLPRPVVLVPLAMAALVMGIVATTTGGQESDAAATIRALENTKAPMPKVTPPAASAAAGASAAPVASAPKKVLLVGDSVAASLGLGFDAVTGARNLAVWDRGHLGCGLLTGGDVLEGGLQLAADPGCDWRAPWAADLAQFQPDVAVMLVGAWDVLDRQLDGEWLRFGTPAYDSRFLSELDQSTLLLGSRGARVIVLTTPFFSRPELAVDTGRQWPEYDPSRVDHLNALYRTFAATHPGRVNIIDLNRFVSPNGVFTDEINGVRIRGDGVHFTPQGSELIDKWLAPQITAVANGANIDPNGSAAPVVPGGVWGW
jgi:peptidoglycan/LPS O-acetylase OafA/YrhL